MYTVNLTYEYVTLFIMNAFVLFLPFFLQTKLPYQMHRDVIVFNSLRWTAKELQKYHVVDLVVPTEKVLEESLLLAHKLMETKGQGPSRIAMEPIKRKGETCFKCFPGTDM